MKTYSLSIVISCVFSFSCFGQRASSNTPAVTAMANAHSTIDAKSDSKSDDGLVIESYYVEETINMPFGRRVTKYEVSKLDMVNTYDLGPNNTRTVTPIYKKAKVKPTQVAILSQTVKEPVANIDNVKVTVIAPSQEQKYLTVDLTDTYMKVVDRGYTSVEMLKKVADKHYFNGEMNEAVKYYGQLLEVSPDLEASYYYRYAQSLKETGQKDKAAEMMVLFESKNSDKIAKE